MTPDQNISTPTVINGGQKLTVTKVDGTTEEVVVRLVPLSQMADYIDSVGQISALVSVVCNKPVSWADELTDESQYAIDELGRKLNDPRVDRYLQRQEAAVRGMLPMAQKIVDLRKSLPTP